MIDKRLSVKIGKAFVPEKIRPGFRQYLLKAGVTEVPYHFFGNIFFWTIGITVVLYFALIFNWIAKKYGVIGLSILSFLSTTLIFLALYAVALSILFFYYDMKIYNRTKEMESVLDEFLQYISQNLKGGMPFDRALYASVKPQFTVLSNEVMIAAKKAITGQDIGSALNELANKYESQTMRRSLNLITESFKSGGELADIIDRIVQNLRETKKLKEEMNAAILNYVIFITIIVTIIAPGMFAISVQLLTILKKFAGELAKSLSSTPGALSISFSGIDLSTTDFTIFCYVSLTIISIFSSMILSIIQRGDIKGGIKYIPVFILATCIMFFTFSLILTNVMKLFNIGL